MSEIIKTNTETPKAPVKPIIPIELLPNTLPIPNTTASVAPKDAPDDTPNVYGDASWFFNIDCTTAPLVAKHPPTKNANKTLGNLIFHIIDTSFGITPSLRGIFINLFAIIDIVSNILILELPMEVPI